MIDGGDDVEFESTVGGGLKDACVDLDLFDSWAEQLLKSSYDPCLFACSRWSVHEKVWEVTALGLTFD